MRFIFKRTKKIDLSKSQDQSQGNKEGYLEKIEKHVYLKALNKLLKTVEDYAKLGLPVTFPFIIANDK
uniref:hypothetical protein n=1 Tax=Mycoplasmopsis bovis TaxID=28903 RepID=UPI003D2D4794